MEDESSTHDLRQRLAAADAEITALRATVARLRAERTHRHEREQSYLLRLSDTLRMITTPEEVQAAALNLVAGELGLARAAYWDVDPDQEHTRKTASFDGDLPPLPDRMRMTGFGPDQLAACRAGMPYVVADTATEPRAAVLREAGIGAWVGVPLVRTGQLVAILGAAKGEPHSWTRAEVRMLQETAERTRAAAERAAAEAALRASEARFREFGENSSDALWIVDAEQMRLEYLSPAYERIWGESRDAVLADLAHWGRRVHPDDRPAALQAMPRLLAGKPFVCDYRIVRPDGEVRWIRDTGFPITTGGTVTRGGGIAQDVTELMRIETALVESEERLALAIEVGQLASWDWNMRTDQITWNDRHFAMQGYGAGEVTPSYEAWLARLHPDDRDQAIAAIAAARENRQPYANEFRLVRPDGATRWCSARGRFFYDDAGQPCRMIGVIDDVTDRKLAEVALRESEERLKALIEGIPQLVWRAGNPGEWTWVSPQWSNFTGQNAAASRGWGWLKAVHPDDRREVTEAWAQAPRRGALDATYRVRSAEGNYRWFRTRAMPVRDGKGQIAEWFGTSTDIHDLREIQSQQEVLVSELQHRTRNLMAVIQATSDMTARTSADLDEFLARFRDRMGALARVQGLLSRLGRKQRLTFDVLVRTEVRAMGAEGRVVLDGPPDIMIRSAKVQTLSMALHELATNAVKYGALAEPGGRLAVTWRLREADGEACLDIDWIESGVQLGPERINSTPSQGRRLIERALPHQLQARVDLQLKPGGLECRIALPLS